MSTPATQTELENNIKTKLGHSSKSTTEQSIYNAIITKLAAITFTIITNP